VSTYQVADLVAEYPGQDSVGERAVAAVRYDRDGQGDAAPSGGVRVDAPPATNV
jgi:hypothetical protein